MRLGPWGGENNPPAEIEAALPDISSRFWRFDHANRTTVSDRGHDFECSQARSSSGEWVVAFGRASGSEGCRVFGFRGDELVYTVPITRPTEAWIADDGTALVVDSGEFETSGGGVVVVGPDGEALVSDSFASNVNGAAITTDGTHAAVVTLNPDKRLSLYEIATGDRLVRHEIEYGSRHGVFLTKSNSTVFACLIDDVRNRLLYAIDAQGDVVWRSDYVRSRVPLFTRVLSRLRNRTGT